MFPNIKAIIYIIPHGIWKGLQHKNLRFVHWFNTKPVHIHRFLLWHQLFIRRLFTACHSVLIDLVRNPLIGIDRLKYLTAINTKSCQPGHFTVNSSSICVWNRNALKYELLNVLVCPVLRVYLLSAKKCMKCWIYRNLNSFGWFFEVELNPFLYRCVLKMKQILPIVQIFFSELVS